MENNNRIDDKSMLKDVIHLLESLARLMKILFDISSRYGDSSATKGIFESLLLYPPLKNDVVGVVWQMQHQPVLSFKLENGLPHFYDIDYDRDRTTIGEVLASKLSIRDKCRVILMRMGKCLGFLTPKWRHNMYARIAKATHFSYVVKLTYFNDGLEELISFCSVHKIGFQVILVDPLSLSAVYPSRISRDLSRLEKRIISKADALFVPQGWHADYQYKYHSPKVREFFFPLIGRNRFSRMSFVLPHFTKGLRFAYFGSIDSQRGDNKLFRMFFKNRKLHVFGDVSAPDSQIWVLHKRMNHFRAVSAAKLFDALIVIDNAGPTRNYIPSKVFMYIEARKPIIVFGDVNPSSTKTLLSDYSLAKYCSNVNDLASIEDFVAQAPKQKCDISRFRRNTSSEMGSIIVDIMENSQDRNKFHCDICAH